MTSSTFPSIWKKSHVIPLPKVKNCTELSHFRSINILPALSKALEKLVNWQLSSYLQRNALIDPLQSGFRQRHSTTTALLKITDDVRQAMDNQELTVMVLLDYSAAFNSVDLDLLTTKMKYEFNFSDGCVRWFDSYLHGRQQRVTGRDGQFSPWVNVNKSVPAGASLGPIMFNMYTNSLHKVLSPSVMHHSFADDVQCYSHCKVENLQQTINNINKDLSAVSRWSTSHALILHPLKSQTIIIGSQRLLNAVNFETLQPVEINGTAVPFSRVVKDLGILIDSQLSWKDQVLATCRKMYGCLHPLQRLKNLLPFGLKKHLVQVLILPILDYCDVVQVNMSGELMDKLGRVYNSCVRFICRVKKYDHITPAYKSLSWLKIRERQELHICTHLHKIIKTQTPNYLNSRFHTLASHHNIHTRSGNKLTIPNHRTNFYHKSFTVTASRAWNGLSEDIRGEAKYDKFKKLCQNQLLAR